jgi:hypothetical protein
MGQLMVHFMVHFIPAPEFAQAQQMGTVTSSSVTEASGLCASRAHPNVLYTHNDSGHDNEIYAIDATSGHRLATIAITGAHSRDWEDIACGPCTDLIGHCIYIGDTGGNTGNNAANVIYRVREPGQLHKQMDIQLDSFLKFK